MTEAQLQAKNLHVRLDVRVTNPLNGQLGNSKLSGIIRARERKKLRRAAVAQCNIHFGAVSPWVRLGHAVFTYVDREEGVASCVGHRAEALDIVLTRVAPRPLDQHDGLGAALKPIIDGVADYLGVKDNDPRVTWKLEQRKGRVREYCVEISIASAAVDSAAQSQGSDGVHRGADDLAVSSHFPASPPRARGRTA